MCSQSFLDELLNVCCQGVTRSFTRVQNNKRLYNGIPNSVRRANYCGDFDGRMSKQTVLDFARTNSVTRTADNIVIASDKSNVTFGILDTFIAR